MSSFYKLKALVKKNFLELRRNIFSTILEVFLPIILISLFWLLKKAYDIDEFEFVKNEKNIKNFIKERSVVNKDFDDSVSDSDSDSDSDSWYGLSTNQPLFDFCVIPKYYDNVPFVRPYIAVVGEPEFLSYFEEKMNATLKIKNSNVTLKNFTSIEQMEDDVKKMTVIIKEFALE
jgi:hypothetical protein